jgi:hypothetical protein
VVGDLLFLMRISTPPGPARPSFFKALHLLTEVEEHGDEDNQTKPGVECGYKVNNGNDDISNSRYQVEHNGAEIK